MWPAPFDVGCCGRPGRPGGAYGETNVVQSVAVVGANTEVSHVPPLRVMPVTQNWICVPVFTFMFELVMVATPLPLVLADLLPTALPAAYHVPVTVAPDTAALLLSLTVTVAVALTPVLVLVPLDEIE